MHYVVKLDIYGFLSTCTMHKVYSKIDSERVEFCMTGFLRKIKMDYQLHLKVESFGYVRGSEYSFGDLSKVLASANFLHRWLWLWNHQKTNLLWATFWTKKEFQKSFQKVFKPILISDKLPAPYRAAATMASWLTQVLENRVWFLLNSN